MTRVYAAQDEGATLYAAGMESSAGSISIASTLADGQTLKLGKNGAVEMIISPHGTSANETFSLTNTSGTAESAIALTSSAGGVDVDAPAAKDVNIAGGQVALVSKDNAASAISLTANQGTSETIVITNTLGTSSSAVDINAGIGPKGLPLKSISKPATITRTPPLARSLQTFTISSSKNWASSIPTT